MIVSGFMMRLELQRKPNKSLKETLIALKSMTERVLVWVKCPKCGWDVPAIDMTVDGKCFYCMAKEIGKLETGKYEKQSLTIGDFQSNKPKETEKQP
jgi:hypothetical protein